MSKQAPLRLIDEDKIPKADKTERWLRILNQIPAGKAWVTSDKELDVSPAHLSYLVKRLVKEKRLPSGFHTVQRKMDDRLVIYVVNSGNHDSTRDAK